MCKLLTYFRESSMFMLLSTLPLPHFATLQALVTHLADLIRMHPSPNTALHSLSVSFGPLILRADSEVRSFASSPVSMSERMSRNGALDVAERVRFMECLLSVMVAKTSRILKDIETITFAASVCRRASSRNAGQPVQITDQEVLKVFTPAQPRALRTQPSLATRYQAITTFLEDSRISLFQELSQLASYIPSRLAMAVRAAQLKASPEAKPVGVTSQDLVDWRRESEKLVALTVQGFVGK